MYHAVAAGSRELQSHIVDCLVREPAEYSEKVRTFFAQAYVLGINDPDGESDLLQKIYHELWTGLVEKKFMQTKKGRIASDTMTSAQTSLNKAMRAFSGEENLKKLYVKGKICYCRNCSVALAANNTDTHFYELLERKYPHFKSFISAYHTLGNYCPVPDGFNSARSGFGKGGPGEGAVYDYWDLTLKKIYEWYSSYEEGRDDGARDNLIREELLNGRGNHENCVEWLKYFGKGQEGWKNFVNTLYFQDYVEDYKSGNYKPKQFWKEHDWKQPALPKEKCDEFFKEVSDRIQKRGRRLVCALLEKA